MNPDSISPGALKTEEEHRRDICAVGQWIHKRSYVASTDGNISLRLDPRRILTSPTGISKGMMTPEDMVITDLNGVKLSGRRNPSSELAMHLLIYRRRPDINAVCHAHPPTATGYASAGIPLNKAILAELVLSLGCIPVAGYGTPGTAELTDAIEPLVQSYDAILMANHGVVTYGPDLLTAFFRMETTEHFAQVALVTETAWQTSVAFRRGCGKIARGTGPVWGADGCADESELSGDVGCGWARRFGARDSDAARTGNAHRRGRAERTFAAAAIQQHGLRTVHGI